MKFLAQVRPMTKSVTRMSQSSVRDPQIPLMRVKSEHFFAQLLLLQAQVKHMFDDLVDCKRILRETAIMTRILCCSKSLFADRH